MVEFTTRFGDHIRELRLRKLLSQEKLAQICNVSKDTISSLEQGRRKPSRNLCEKLGQALEDDGETLFFEANMEESIGHIPNNRDNHPKIYDKEIEDVYKSLCNIRENNKELFDYLMPLIKRAIYLCKAKQDHKKDEISEWRQ